MQTLQHKLLTLLADGQFHSGEQLSRTLGISRTRVHHGMQSLRNRGLSIAAVKGRGYCIFDGIDLLDAQYLKQAFPQLGVEVFDAISSTNDYCLSLTKNAFEQPVLCLAEQQSKGRGRQSKVWQSPFAANVYMSLLYRFEQAMSHMAGLTLAVGLCIAELLTQTGVKDVAVKWPNDVYVGGKKIAGILTEVVGDALGPTDVVIGIGLNVRMPLEANNYIDQAWTDCQTACPLKLSRTQWAEQLTRQLLHTIDIFAQYGLAAFLLKWQQYDYLQGQSMTILHSGQSINTQGCGITHEGYLRIAHPPYKIASGDIVLPKS
jgi:BirA family biotin operon repressor/biotin-[acetyl-CoA-carboxylase] ligase